MSDREGLGVWGVRCRVGAQIGMGDMAWVLGGGLTSHYTALLDILSRRNHVSLQEESTKASDKHGGSGFNVKVVSLHR